ncbi:hypothetical protein [Methanobrevibacter sp.]|uniref:hypothetical protein n=1 Tax=Methanobrevibacter sp. TaxID=66852 RepID=UPI003869DD64
MWIAPKDDGFRPCFERDYAYGIFGNLEIVEELQQKSDSEKIEYENKLREENPDRYEMFKHWCRHHGYLKDFYHYEDPVYISFEGEEWEKLVEESKKAKNNEEKVKILKKYSKIQPFLPVIEEKEKNTKTINEILEENGFEFQFENFEANLKLIGKFVFDQKYFNENTGVESWIFQDQLYTDDKLIVSPKSKKEPIKYISSLELTIYNEKGFAIEVHKK